MPPYVSVSSSGGMGQELAAAFERLSRDAVLVGIPESATQRQGKGPITNAQLLFIHTNGSPVNHLPARPVLEPAVEDQQNQSLYTAPLIRAVDRALAGDAAGVSTELDQAGRLASNAARAWFTNPNNRWAALAPSTVRRKLGRLRSRDKIAATQALAQIIKQNWDTTGVFTTLVEKGEMRGAITWVVERG